MDTEHLSWSKIDGTAGDVGDVGDKHDAYASSSTQIKWLDHSEIFYLVHALSLSAGRIVYYLA